MRSLILLTGFMVLISWGLVDVRVYAEDSKDKEVSESGKSLHVFLAAGGTRLREMDNVNSELERYGYPALQERYFMMGGGLRFRIDRVIVGCEGHGFRSKPRDTDNYRVSMSGGYGVLEFGYDVIASGGFRLFPLIGIGGGGAQLNIYNKNDVTFSELMANPGRGSQITSGGMIMNLSLGVEYFWKLVRSGGIVLGVQMGYNHSLTSGDWYLFSSQGEDSTHVSGGPKLKLNGGYAHLTIGWRFLF